MLADMSFFDKRYYPERKLFLLTLEMALPLDIGKISDRLIRFNIKLLTTLIQANPEHNTANITVILDYTDATITPASHVILLRQMPEVKNVRLINMPLAYGEARMVALPIRFFHQIFKLLRQLGATGLSLMYNMGYLAGRERAQVFRQITDSNEELLRIFLSYEAALGTGRFALKSYTPRKRCVIEAYDLYECVGVKSREPNSHLFRGLLAGFLTELWGREVMVTETKCIAKGDEACVFEARAREEAATS